MMREQFSVTLTIIWDASANPTKLSFKQRDNTLHAIIHMKDDAGRTNEASTY